MADTAEVLELARAGDGEAFRELTEPYRRELQVHCYRILGSLQDAEDLLQETLLAAWRGLDSFEGRASMRTWLYRIATNRCLNALRAGERRRQRETESVTHAAQLPEPTRSRAEPEWLEPYPDSLLADLPDRAPGPEARYETREAVSLAFLSGLQQLPPRQRAALVLRDVLGFRAAEVAGMLDATENAVNNALQRARARLAAELPEADREQAPLPGSAQERRVVEAFTRAFEVGDVEAIVALLTDDVWLTMPPLEMEYQGHEAVGNFLRTVVLSGGRTFVLRPVRANGQPAFGFYRRDRGSAIVHGHGLMVLTLSGDRISALTRFIDNGLLRDFGLSRSLREA
ncbi:sigma-70 family RNA polymerase sigma factor [Actinacidiphila bryophytorum]|uniref:sigma-70 family RNA polymerase sigma factor n=1 Tax=Actinacidiphila bryophytorum TaxID=1436133 RepID=UPI002176C30D|nr:sigma-70 family RNA polymerase sigma factor [Actinacidiphila bryophytorum]UWE13148.1 sigma-70 family RNA polymerase sigma factor [Actinacidiphila bryophytorum]